MLGVNHVALGQIEDHGDHSSMPDSPTAKPSILAHIGLVFRQNRSACVLLNLLVITLVTTYYQVPAVTEVWENIGAFKTRWSYGFSLLSTILAASVLPFCVYIYLHARGHPHKNTQTRRPPRHPRTHKHTTSRCSGDGDWKRIMSPHIHPLFCQKRPRIS